MESEAFLYKIIVNGMEHGSYPSMQYARNAIKSMSIPRAKNTYSWQLLDTKGNIIDSGTTPTTRALPRAS